MTMTTIHHAIFLQNQEEEDIASTKDNVALVAESQGASLPPSPSTSLLNSDNVIPVMNR